MSEKLSNRIHDWIMNLIIDGGDFKLGISLSKEVESLEKNISNAKLAVERICYQCQDFNDPPYCNNECHIWTLRFPLNVRNCDIWPEDDDCPVEESYEKAKKV